MGRLLEMPRGRFRGLGGGYGVDPDTVEARRVAGLVVPGVAEELAPAPVPHVRAVGDTGWRGGGAGGGQGGGGSGTGGIPGAHSHNPSFVASVWRLMGMAVLGCEDRTTTTITRRQRFGPPPHWDQPDGIFHPVAEVVAVLGVPGRPAWVRMKPHNEERHWETSSRGSEGSRMFPNAS